MSSILSFKDRGDWGDSNWHGNCSGHVYRHLFELIKPKTFVDPMAGSFTSIQVAKEMNVQAWGMDLHAGFNAVTDSILNEVGQQVDLCISHPPYLDMVVYSGNVWGEPHPGDLSRCATHEDFYAKMVSVLLNQRDAVKPGSMYGTIIGDLRRNGKYYSSQAELICRMPSDELAGVLIKAQHNVRSNANKYRLALPSIQHEYILLWRKVSAPVIVLLSKMAKEQAQRLKSTWKAVVNLVVQRLGGKASLSEIYDEVARAAPERLASNDNWKAKVRQVLNSTGDYVPVERGVWAFA